MPKATDEDIAAARAANPGVELHITSHPAPALEEGVQEFIVKVPNKSAWNLYRGKQASESEKIYADDFLFDSCVVWPAKEARDAIVAKSPALLNMCAAEITEIAGASRNGSHRKL